MDKMINYCEKNYNKLIYIPFCMLFFYVFNFSFQNIIFSNDLFLLVYSCLAFLLLFVLHYNDIREKKYFKHIWLIYVILILIVIFSHNVDIMLHHFNYAFFITLFLGIFVVLTFSKKWYKAAFNTALVFALSHVFFTWLFYFLPSFYEANILPLFPDFTKELTFQFTHHQMAGLTNHYSTNAMYLTYATIALYTLIKKEVSFKNIIIIILFIVTLGALLLTGKRAPLIFCLMTIIATYIIKNRENLRKNIIVVVTVGVISIGAFWGATYVVPELANPIIRIVQILNRDNILGPRKDLYGLAIDMFKEKPILGYGWGSYKYLYNERIEKPERENMQTHNVYLQLFAEVGVIGASIIIFAFFYSLFLTLKVITRQKNNLTPLYFSLCYQFYFLLYCITGNALYDMPTLAMYIFVLSPVYSYAYFPIQSAKKKHINNNESKIGILTFQNTVNYGAKFQEYALQKYINLKGIKAEVIDYQNEKIEKQEMPISPLCLNIKNWIKYIFIHGYQVNKLQKFINFTNKNINTSTKRYNKKNIADANSEYDAFLVGSDQIWNLQLTGNDTTYYLDFAEDSKKKYSYAASFGTTDFTKEELQVIKNKLKKLDTLNLREEQGKELAIKLGFNNANRVMDPTFVIDSKEWHSFVSERKVKEDYIFMYLLDLKEDVFSFVYSLAKKENLKIIFLTDSIRHFKYTKVIHDASVEDFLNYVKYAKYIVTGSFHLICMSLIFEKNFFYTFNSNNRSSRIVDLIDLVDLNDRKIEHSEVKDSDLKDLNYDIINKKLKKEIEKSRKILDNMIGVKND